MTRRYIWDRRRFLFFPEVSAKYLARFTLECVTTLTEHLVTHYTNQRNTSLNSSYYLAVMQTHPPNFSKL